MTELLHRMVAEWAAKRPEAPAVRCDGQEVDYGTLTRRVHGLAHVLRSTGLADGDRVGVWLGKGLKVPVSFYGVSAAGGVLVPIDPKSPVEQVVRILTATGATHLVTEEGRRRALSQILDACPGIRQVVGVDPETRGGEATRASFVSWETVLSEARDEAPTSRVMEMDPAYVLHTSGSTGTPKLIQHTHRSAMAFVDWAAAEYGLTSEDRLSNHSSHHTCFATFDYYAAARVGAATVVLTPAAMMLPASLAQLVARERISVWYSVPTALIQLALRGDLESRDLAALRWVLFAGETFPAKHLQRIRQLLPGARFSHVYGSTETNVCTYFHLPGGSDGGAMAEGPLPIGQACSNARAMVVDEALREVLPGEEGELLIRGSTVMSGYWGDPARNRQVFFRQPVAGELEEIFFRTGDQVRQLADGNLTFVARADHQVKIRGHRVELGEVETALLAVDAVEEAVAFTMPNNEGSSDLWAAVVVSPAAECTLRDLQRHLAVTLPRQAVPTEIQVLDALPRTPTGKVDRKALVAEPAATR